MFRSHQRDLDQLLDQVCRNLDRPKIVLLQVVPGGGKSLCVPIMAARLIPKIADRVAWFAPRLALQEQGEAAFQTGWLRTMLGVSQEIRQSTNESNPCRDKIGYVSTHQAVCENPSLHRDEFERHRYILVIDELHHFDEGGVSHRAFAPLIERAAMVFLMTGSLSRADGKPIAFLPLVRAQQERRGQVQEGWTYDLEPTADFRRILYPRSLAIQEQAIRRLELEHHDGATVWREPVGDGASQEKFADLSSAGPDSRKAIYTALNTGFARELLERCVEDWRAYQAQVPAAKLLVVAASIAHAREYLRWLRALGVPAAEIATTEDSRAALASIRRFKRPNRESGALRALVTVAMAYEGLDVPCITHIACLTHIRTLTWIDQMVSRADRVAPELGPWSAQVGRIFGPADELLMDIFEQIRADQNPFVKDPTVVPPTDGRFTDAEGIAPIWSRSTDETVSGLGMEDRLSAYQVAVLREKMAEHGLVGSLTGALAWLREQGLDIPERSPAAPDANVTSEPGVPPSLREGALRKQIDRHCRAYDARHDLEPGTMNKRIYATLRKRRRDLSEAELIELWLWLQEQFPLSDEAADAR